MTIGYLLVDNALLIPAKHKIDCAGPSGLSPSAIVSTAGNGAAIRWVALLALCAAYLQGGLGKLVDFGGAVAEAQHFGLPFATAIAVGTIVTELVGSALVLSGHWRWFGALWLAVFTLVAAFVANRFWEMPGAGRFMAENAFFEHVGLAGGLLLVAWHDIRERNTLVAGAHDVHSDTSN